MGRIKLLETGAVLNPGRREISDIEKILRDLEYVVDREADGGNRLWAWVRSAMRTIAGQEPNERWR